MPGNHRLITGHNRDFDRICSQFSWNIPEHFNIADAVCDRHTDLSGKLALICEHEQGQRTTYTFSDIRRLSNQLANVLKAKGINRGDRVAIVLPQRVETAIAHLAAFKIGAITVPLSVLFGEDALRFRLGDSGAALVISDQVHQGVLETLRPDLELLQSVINCDEDGKDGLWPLMSVAGDQFECTRTRADDPAIIIYTSGTTGPPKGALVAHRCLLGNLPGFEMSQEYFPQKDDLFWTPADWA